eukprot:2481483-Ditylum_brightwellii.AAC.1
MCKVVKCNLVDIAEKQFDLVEALLDGDTFTHWQEFKCIKSTHNSNSPVGADTAPKGMCPETFKLC